MASCSTSMIDIKVREKIDSRGNPTIEVEILCGGTHGRAAVPSGASTAVCIRARTALERPAPLRRRGEHVRSPTSTVRSPAALRSAAAATS